VVLNDGGSIVMNVGSTRGVIVGMMFDVFRIRQIKDPGSGKMLSARVPTGRLEVISVSEDSAVGRLKSGTADASSVVEGSH
jgi:hypothetical protein